MANDLIYFERRYELYSGDKYLKRMLTHFYFTRVIRK